MIFDMERNLGSCAEYTKDTAFAPVFVVFIKRKNHACSLPKGLQQTTETTYTPSCKIVVGFKMKEHRN
jgi:hypothetical protein